MKFDLTDLRIFLAAVDNGSFSAAAVENNIVVAAVSARIRRLEEAFRVELFERTGRGIRTTLAGDMFATHARKIVDDARRVESELDEFAEGRSGQVRLLSNTNMLAEHMPRVLGTFLATNPDISVDVIDRPSHEVVTMLKNGEADIGIVAASADMTGLERWRFVPDHLVLIAPCNFDVTDESINYTRILDFPMIGMPETVALSQFLGRLARELGRDIKVRMRMNGFEGIARMVESGAGVAIVPHSAAQRYRTFMDFRILEIADAWADRKLFLCVRHEAELPRFAKRLLEHLRRYAEVT
ncbi:LysR family transcriptional regulator [Rhizobium oryzicola]|uniref:LysR family transcriptional regulator n=1 Tax=Rhizobium oryzicola TaxID=1232668 RepID=A0ABT8SY36_9HYPH|nr:LysR family transcriptional regulator [Rhizobium oryzicola]MDO1583367.1 LysR family transcriptional regulator [Rhizobium oryzicola]